MAFIPGNSPWLTNRMSRDVPARRPRTCLRRPQGENYITFMNKHETSNIPDDSTQANNGIGSAPSREFVSNSSDNGSSAVETTKGKTQLSSQNIDEEELEVEVDCVGDFLYSASLHEYREQKEAGLLSAAVDSSSEWSDAWALAVQPRKGEELKNQYSRVGICVQYNFDDFVEAEGCVSAFTNATLEDIALTKAKLVYESTGLPAIAETHDLYIEPPESGSNINKTLQQGYYTRNVEEEGDALIERVRPISDENRITRFCSAAAYYDGEMQIITRKEVTVAIIFSGAHYVTIAITAATDDLYKALYQRLGFTLTNPGKPRAGTDTDDEGEEEKPLVGATLLKERILREGKVLSDSILKVSSFMNHMVDTDLMDVCGEELAERLRDTMPNKLLTVESTGLIVGLPTARKLGIPLLFARKSRPITISDSYQTTYRSATKGTTNELIVSCEYLEAGDRVLIIDDFLAGGSTAEALFKLAKMAHAKVVGVGVLIEKMTDGGRAFLSGYDVPVESLAKILPSNDKGRIQFVEEEPWVRGNKHKGSKTEYYGRTKGEYDNIEERIDSESDNKNNDDDDYIDEETVDVITWEDEEEFDDLEESLIRENGR